MFSQADLKDKLKKESMHSSTGTDCLLALSI